MLSSAEIITAGIYTTAATTIISQREVPNSRLKSAPKVIYMPYSNL